MAAPLAALLDGPAAETYAPANKGTARIGVLVAALLVLQTQVEFKREANGTWTFSAKKEATSGELLAPVVQKLLGLPAAGK